MATSVVFLIRRCICRGGLAHTWLALIVLVVCGCGSGDGLNRQPLAGTVTLNGAVLTDAMIRFEPLGKEPTTAGADIVNGKYEISREHGLAPGRYRVLIFQPDATRSIPPVGGLVEEAQAMSAPPPAVERLPAKYNVNSTLRVEISEGDHDRLDFKLFGEK